METLEPILKQHPFFEGLDAAQLNLIVGCASNTRFQPGAYLFRTGEEATQFFLIRQGRIAIEIYAPQRPPIVIQTLEEGDVLGWSWLIPPHRWRFDARAVGAARAIALDGKCLRTKGEADYNLGYELMKRVAQIMMERLQATRIRLLDIYSDRPGGRL